MTMKTFYLLNNIQTTVHGDTQTLKLPFLPFLISENCESKTGLTFNGTRAVTDEPVSDPDRL